MVQLTIKQQSARMSWHVCVFKRDQSVAEGCEAGKGFALLPAAAAVNCQLSIAICRQPLVIYSIQLLAPFVNALNVLGFVECSITSIGIHHAFPIGLANNKANFPHLLLCPLLLNISPAYLECQNKEESYILYIHIIGYIIATLTRFLPSAPRFGGSQSSSCKQSAMLAVLRFSISRLVPSRRAVNRQSSTISRTVSLID